MICGLECREGFETGLGGVNDTNCVCVCVSVCVYACVHVAGCFSTNVIGSTTLVYTSLRLIKTCSKCGLTTGQD